jgi:hypothetical protein
MEFVVDRTNKQEAKATVERFLATVDANTDLVIFTDRSAHPEGGLVSAAVSMDGKLTNMDFLGPPGTATKFKCKLVGIRQ